MLRKAIICCAAGMFLATCIQPTVLCGQEAVLKEQGSTKEKAKVQTKSKRVVPVFTMYYPIQEAPLGEDPFSGAGKAEPLKDFVARLGEARDDEDVEAVALVLGDMPLGAAQLEEIYQSLTDIRKAGKPVYAFADHLTFRDLALVSSATRISIAPVGELMISGMYGSQLHLRGLLDKVHVTPDFHT
jgi:protease-4